VLVSKIFEMLIYLVNKLSSNILSKDFRKPIRFWSETNWILQMFLKFCQGRPLVGADEKNESCIWRKDRKQLTSLSTNRWQAAQRGTQPYGLSL